MLKEGMSDWLGNDRKMTSHRNFKLKFSKRSLDLVRGFQFESDVVEKFDFHGYSSD